MNLHTCRIGVRGRGGKRTVEVQTIGTPIFVDDKRIVAKSFDYSGIKEEMRDELMASLVKEKAFILAKMIDYVRKMRANGAASQSTLLRERLVREGIVRADLATLFAMEVIKILDSNAKLVKIGKAQKLTVDESIAIISGDREWATMKVRKPRQKRK